MDTIDRCVLIICWRPGPKNGPLASCCWLCWTYRVHRACHSPRKLSSWPGVVMRSRGVSPFWYHLLPEIRIQGRCHQGTESGGQKKKTLHAYLKLQCPDDLRHRSSIWLAIYLWSACVLVYVSLDLIWSQEFHWNYQDYWAGRQDTFVWGTKSIIATCEATDRGHEEEIKGLALLYYTGGFLRTWCAWIKERAVFGWQPQPATYQIRSHTHTHFDTCGLRCDFVLQGRPPFGSTKYSDFVRAAS